MLAAGRDLQSRPTSWGFLIPIKQVLARRCFFYRYKFSVIKWITKDRICMSLINKPSAGRNLQSRPVSWGLLVLI